MSRSHASFVYAFPLQLQSTRARLSLAEIFTLLRAMSVRLIRWLEDDLLEMMECFFRPFPFIFINMLIIMVVAVEYSVVLPYEYKMYGFWIGSFVALIGLYLVINILFHLSMTFFVCPGYVALTNRSPRCEICTNYKPQGTHHCRMCDRCIRRMDHHCFFIGQCIGLYNHRHFVQFAGFLLFACFYALIAGSNTIWHNLIWRTPEKHYCSVLPDDSIIRRAMCFTEPYALSTFVIAGAQLLIFLGLMASLAVFLWQAAMVSYGTTAIEYSRANMNLSVSQVFSQDSKNHWITFLGLDKPGRSFFRHVLVPSAHKPSYANYL